MPRTLSMDLTALPRSCGNILPCLSPIPAASIAGLGKAAVREIAKQLGLPVWNKPATPCLASRVPIGTVVTVARLRQIETAEHALKTFGFSNVRVRHHGRQARVELSQSGLAHALERTPEIVSAIQASGFDDVRLELASRKEE